jgi:hypothetical protein
MSLDAGDSIVLAKSFSHMLNLANLAEEVSDRITLSFLHVLGLCGVLVEGLSLIQNSMDH